MARSQGRLYKGAIRELHWHIYSEWGYVLYGNARITAVDPYGRVLWKTLRLGTAGYFLLVILMEYKESVMMACCTMLFDNGNLAGNTLLLTDWMNHVPDEVLAKNFQVPSTVFKNIPNKPLQFFPDNLPQQSVAEERAEVSKGTGIVPQSFAFLREGKPANATRRGGEILIVDRRNFRATTIAAAFVKLRRGGMRELHWHPNADEWLYFVSGKARMGVFRGDSAARTIDFYAGDVGYVPITVGHYIENTGNDDCVFLELFPTPYYEDVSLAQWLAHTSPSNVDAHIHTGKAFIESINDLKKYIQP